MEQLVGNGVGVGLEGDLRVGNHIEVAADGGQNDGHTLGTEEGGGAAAEVDGVYLIIGCQGTGLLDVIADGNQIAVDQLVILAGQGVEVAVLALAAAEGNVNIKTQGSLVGAFGQNGHKNDLRS